MTERCRKTEPLDYVVTLSLYFGDQILRNVLKTEEEKSLDQRNNVGIILGELSSIGANYLISRVNKNLCVPIV
jgi:hypothetical protein